MTKTSRLEFLFERQMSIKLRKMQMKTDLRIKEEKKD